MFESSVEKTIVLVAIVLWLAHGWYLNQRLFLVHAKLDRTLETLDGLRKYLYEVDPQFDDERHLLESLHDPSEFGSVRDAGMIHMELIEQKARAGKRTLDTSFGFERWFAVRPARP